MADNTQLNPGTGGDVIATDDIAGVKHQLVKVEFGDDGAATQVSATNRLPVADQHSQPLTDAQLRAASVPVSGPLTDSQLRATPVTVETELVQPLTNEQLRATPVPVDITGEIIEAIETMRMAIQALTRTVGLAQVNPTTGRMLVEIGASTNTQTVTGTVAATQSGTWNITNLATIGGQAANSQIPSFERMTADNLRRNINVT